MEGVKGIGGEGEMVKGVLNKVKYLNIIIKIIIFITLEKKKYKIYLLFVDVMYKIAGI